jgi:threonine aldolase
MAGADVGDAVFGEDPTVAELERVVAHRLGFEAGAFVPSGIMANQVALMAHCHRGDGVLVSQNGHMLLFETGAAAAIAGVQLFEIGDANGFNGRHIEQAYRGNAYIYPPTRLVVVENTHNFGGGRVTTVEQMRDIVEAASGRGLPVHVDGARIANAAVALRVDVAELTRGCASASICLSKGLGAPVGSVLVGSLSWIERARRFRRMLGGGMRQAGVLAAAGLVAIESQWNDLEADHRRARTLASRLSGLRTLRIDPASVATNIVIVESERPASEVCERLEAVGVRTMPFGSHRVRFVLHRDIDDGQLDEALSRIEAVLG